MGSRTLIAWIDGERFVFHDDEVDHVLDLGAEAETVSAAWDALIDYGYSFRE